MNEEVEDTILEYRYDIPYTQTQYWFESQRVDHVDPSDPRRWSQRYWAVEDYFDRERGAVILCICGEYTCPGVNPDRLFPVMLARRYGALVLVLEHRYYGQSMPLGDVSLKTENMRYLNVQQAVDDLAYFINWVKKTERFGVKNYMPWLSVGGSYPGALSSYLRYKYPHLTVGALGSSPSFVSSINFPQFDKTVYEAVMRSGPECVADIQALTSEAERQLASENSTEFKARFKSESLNSGEFLFMFADLFVELVQYGKRTWLCELLANQTTLQGKMEAMAVHTRTSVAIEEYGSYYLKNDTYDPNHPWFGRQWYYQSCTQVGFMQTFPLEKPENSLRSQQLNIEFYKQWCKDSYGESFYGQYLWPEENAYHTIFGGRQINVKNLIVTNGGEDPWQPSSILRRPNKSYLIVQDIDCENCAHCVDLYTPRPDDAKTLRKARAETTRLFGKWIKEHYKRVQEQFAKHFNFDL